ncbi:MAG: hypothetical protein JXB32_26165 [Deltaproteobacteria bacterium]|nr:hypothetical protein [Deltaproteobacteria bacterium]
MRSSFGKACVVVLGVLPALLAACGSSSTNDGGDTAGELGETGDSVPPDVPTDTPVEGTADVPVEDGRLEGGDGGREDGAREDVGSVDGATGDGAGGCDPTMCSISCMLSGYGEGTCVGDECECSGEPSDGGTGDGSTADVPFDVGPLPDFGLDIGLDFGLPDFGLPDFGLPDFGLPDFGLPDGIALPDGFELPEGWDASAVDATMDLGAACEATACFDACRASGHSFGFCDASGVCVCY